MSTTPSPRASCYAHCGHGADPRTDPVGRRGIHVFGHTACLAHLQRRKRRRYLASLSPGTDIDHRGTPFTETPIWELLLALRDPTSGRPQLGRARFDGATFTGHADFDLVPFTGDAWFNEARFTGDAAFSGRNSPVPVKARPMVTAGFTKDVEEVNQYAAPM
jgi:hypothetical protein